MLSLPALALLAVPLHAAPGPTNALLAAVGAERGVVRGVPAMLLVPLGYALAIAGWLSLTVLLVPGSPALLAAWQIVAAAILFFFAWRFWRENSTSAGRDVATNARLFVTTLLNPKALILAIMLMPDGMATGPVLLVAGIALPAACAWLVAGAVCAHMARARFSSTCMCRALAFTYCAFGFYLSGTGIAMAAAALG